MGGKILLVEDDPINSILVQHILEAEGYVVLKASSAKEVLLQIKSDVPDLILMDLQLPDMDGLTLTRMIRENPSTSYTTIVALTAYAMSGDRERALQVGCDGYITKPIDTKGFIKMVASFLESRRVKGSSYGDH
jgi:CheY-like chemotaxis protein